jgi:nicotinamide mononucleotide (NMN) deamidase PncC
MCNPIEAILSSGRTAALVVAGGGSGALHTLLAHPGASRFILEAQIPYSSEALADYLGQPPHSACSAPAVIAMVEKAFERAQFLSNSKTPLGVACTAALQTTRIRKGNDRAFIAFKTSAQTVVHELTVSLGTRQEQETEVSQTLLNYLAEFLAGTKT